jgi:16S rRNA A1518/A1519 N6-dimethyltransferase RsmA/KsgA/DIM1 with predicted DNA glycosylase/AP lyase activity
VHGAFAHRRKTLAGSLALVARGSRAAEFGGAVGRERVRAALTELGHPPDVRAERLSPPQFRELSERLSR